MIEIPTLQIRFAHWCVVLISSQWRVVSSSRWALVGRSGTETENAFLAGSCRTIWNIGWPNRSVETTSSTSAQSGYIWNGQQLYDCSRLGYYHFNDCNHDFLDSLSWAHDPDNERNKLPCRFDIMYTLNAVPPKSVFDTQNKPDNGPQNKKVP